MSAATVVNAPSLEPRVGLRACIFTVGAEPFAFDLRRVREVVVLDELTSVPAAPRQIVGVANLRGDVLPIVDPGRLLGATIRRTGRRRRALVVTGGGAHVGLLIDDVLGLETFDDVLEIGDAPHQPYVACALGRLRRSDGLVTLLDADRIVAALRRRED
jgi:twitching motility protein PilI